MSPNTAALSRKKRASVGNLRFRVHALLHKSRKASVSLVMYVCPSVRSRVPTQPPLDGLSCNLILETFMNICR